MQAVFLLTQFVSPMPANAKTDLITSSIRSSVTDTSAHLSWETRAPSLTWVLYGTSIQFGQEYKSKDYSTVHSVELSDLTPGTNFYFHIITEDKQGEISTDTVPTLYSTVQTLGTADVATLRARLNKLLLQLSALQGNAGIAAAPSATFNLTRTLKQGSAGEDVKKLQQLLNKDARTSVALIGAGSVGFETTYFGPKTTRAVIAFQELYREAVLVPIGLTQGSGIVGPRTTTQLNAIYAAATGAMDALTKGRAAAIAQAPDVVNNSGSGAGIGPGGIGSSQGGGGSSGVTGGTNAGTNIPYSSDPMIPANPTTQIAPIVTPIPPIIPAPPSTPPIIIPTQPGVAGYGPIALTPLARPDYYVTVTGGGTHAGDQANPFSLSEAQSFANQTTNLNRSLIFSLAPGEYGAFEERTTRGVNAWVRYQGSDPNNKPVFRGDALLDAIYIHNAPGAYIIFTNISAYNTREIPIEVENANYVTIRDSYIEGGNAISSVGYAVRVYNANHFTLQNSVVRYGSNGISTYGTNDLTVINNEFVGQLIDGGHFSDMNGFVIIGNDFHDGSDPNNIYPESHVDGVQFHATEGGIRNGIFANNRIANFNGQGLFMAHSSNLPTDTINSIVISDNLITGSYLASPFQLNGDNLTITHNTVAPESPIVSLLTENTNQSTVQDNFFTATFLNCSKNSMQDYNLISRYITFSCNGQNVPVGIHDVTGVTIQVDSHIAPTVDQTFITTAGVRVTGCTMSSTGGAVGSQVCEAISPASPVVPVTPAPVTQTPAPVVLPVPDSTPTLTPEPVTPNPATEPAPSSNLIGYWSFDATDTDGGIAVDRSGKNHNGTLVNTPPSITGHRNEALGFSDASSQSVRIDAANSVLNQGSGSYTVSAWINPSDMSALTGSHFGAGIIKSIGNGGNGSQGDFYLSVDSDGELIFTNWQSSGNTLDGRHYVDLTNPANTTINANNWYHVAATWNGSSNAMYINGQPQTFLTTNADGGYKSATTIGSLINGAAHWQWSGGIDEVKLFNRALSQSEIIALYNGSFSLNSTKNNSFLANIWELFLELFR